MYGLRFKSGWQGRLCLLLGAMLAMSAPLQAQMTDTPRPGEVAPRFDLTTGAAGRVTSVDFLGKRSQFWILQGEKPLLPPDELVVKAAQKAVTQGIAPLVIVQGAEADKAPLWPAPFQTLHDEGNALARPVGAPLFVAIDRAGWVRGVEALPFVADDPNSFALRFLLERTPDPTPAFALGKPAPDFCVRDANGIWRRLSALRGRKNLVLTFFPRCFTGKCKTHLSSLRDSFGAFQLADTEVWAVSVDPAGGEQGQKAFAQSLQLPFPMLPDVGRNLSFLFDAVTTPTDLAKRQSVLVDKEGVVRFIDRDVAPETHGDDLLAHLKELGMTP